MTRRLTPSIRLSAFLSPSGREADLLFGQVHPCSDPRESTVMNHFWFSITAALPVQSSTTPDGGGIAGVLVLVGFALVLALFAWALVRKKRRDRGPALDDGIPGQAALEAKPPGSRVPEADELLQAERDVYQTKSAEERARRERERLERDLREGGGEHLGGLKAQLDAARQAEQEAKGAATQAASRAKQLSQALTATREGFLGRISKVVGAGTIDEGVLGEIEAVLFTADVGTRTAERLMEAVRRRLKGKEIADASRVHEVLRDEVRTILGGVTSQPLKISGEQPHVVMILGVNGAGKTTTIGKLAHQLKSEGHSVLLGAGDTFRAAAAEQLEVWAKRADVAIVQSEKEGADPSSVLFDAVATADKEHIDVVLCDTAGRLHTKVNLMEELKKVTRVLGKAKSGAPHDVILVLDATVGQNAIQQAKQFGEAAPITGIILTKLDGTAKGGVVLGIADELKIPVQYIGVGEKIDDLRPFDPNAFADALFGESTASPQLQ